MKVSSVKTAAANAAGTGSTNRQRMDAVKQAVREIREKVGQYAKERQAFDDYEASENSSYESNSAYAARTQNDLRGFVGDNAYLAEDIRAALERLRMAAFEYNVGLDAGSPVFAAAEACAAQCGELSPFRGRGDDILRSLMDSCDCPAAAAHARMAVYATYGGRESQGWMEVDDKLREVQENNFARVPHKSSADALINALNSAAGAWQAEVRKFGDALDHIEEAVSR